MSWVYTINMANTENGSAITGSVSGNTVYTASGNDGTVQRTFTRSAKTSTLRVQQTRNNYTSSDQSLSVSKGTNSVTLDELLGKYTLVVSNTVAGTSVTWNLNGSLADSETGSGTLTLYKELDADQASSALVLEADGYQDWTDNRTAYPGTTSMTASQEPSVDPLETFYIDAGTTTRNATVVIKDGTTTIGTLTADANGYVSARSFDYQLQSGKDLTLQYSAPNADGENVTKADVDDEEHVNIAYLLNAHFNFIVTADSEASWDINGETGTGNGSASLEARANSLAYMVDETTEGAADWPLPIVLNRMLMEEPWDLIINVGHVVPHEVLGFANHNKNYFIGLGGKDLICAAHMAAASCGIENNLGNLITPLRACFNRAEDELPRQAARSLRASRAGPQRARSARSHRRLRRRRSGNLSRRRPAVARAEHHRLRRAARESRVRHAGRRILQHLGGQQSGLPHADGAGRRRRADRHRPRPEALRRAAGGRRTSSANTATSARRA